VLLSSKGVNMKVLLFRTTPAVTPAPTSEHLALTEEAAPADAKRKVTVYESDMSDEMKDAVLDRAKRLAGVYDGVADPQTKIAQALKVGGSHQSGAIVLD
jgi:hypothetical protein